MIDVVALLIGFVICFSGGFVVFYFRSRNELTNYYRLYKEHNATPDYELMNRMRKNMISVCWTVGLTVTAVITLVIVILKLTESTSYWQKFPLIEILKGLFV